MENKEDVNNKEGASLGDKIKMLGLVLKLVPKHYNNLYVAYQHIKPLIADLQTELKKEDKKVEEPVKE